MADANRRGLADLATTYWSDKGPSRLPFHGYAFVYEALFSNWREKKLNILELGLARTNADFRGRSEIRSESMSPSVQMWLDYFPNAHVTGFDLSDFSTAQNERFTFVQGDLGREADLQKLNVKGQQFDIIVDDGSHATVHQMLTFKELFPLVRDDGFFIIEDLSSQPQEIEQANPATHTMADLLAEYLRLGYFPDCGPVSADAFNAFRDEINCVMLLPYQLVSGKPTQLAVIHKKSGSRFSDYRAKIRFFRAQPTEDDVPSLLKLEAIDPACAYSKSELARVAQQKGDLQQAVSLAREASALEPDDLDLAILLARLLAESGEYEEVTTLALEQMTIEPKALEMARNVIPALIDGGTLNAAEIIIDRMEQIDPKSSHGFYLRGRCDEAQGNFAEASERYQLACERLPAKLPYFEAYARAAGKAAARGDIPAQKVTDTLERLSQTNAAKARTHLIVAQTNAKIGQTEAATHAARRVLNIDPENTKAHQLLSYPPGAPDEPSDRGGLLSRLGKKITGK